MSRHPHLRVIDGHGELTDEVCYGCIQHLKTISNQARKITELENRELKAERRDPLDKQIMEVCLFHKRLLSPSWKIVRRRGAYKDVRDRLMDVDAETGGQAFSVLALRAASVGMSLHPWVREKGIRSASWLFGRTKHVEWMLDEAVSFKRQTGVSALVIVDELGRPGLERLAEQCECGHLRLDHEKERPELDLFDPPCAVHGCACTGWLESLESRLERWKAEQET